MGKCLSGLKKSFAKGSTFSKVRGFESHFLRFNYNELITQLVECTLDKREVNGSNPFKLSFKFLDILLDM